MKPRLYIPAVGLALAALTLAPRLEAQTIPTPESVLGFSRAPTSTWPPTSSRWPTSGSSAAARPRAARAGGHDQRGAAWYMALISSADNLKNVEHYRDIAHRLAYPGA